MYYGIIHKSYLFWDILQRDIRRTGQRNKSFPLKEEKIGRAEIQIKSIEPMTFVSSSKKWVVYWIKSDMILAMHSKRMRMFIVYCDIVS